MLHTFLTSTWFYRQEVYDVPDLATALLVTYDDVREDTREYFPETSWDDFLARMSRVKPDWAGFSKDVMAGFGKHPEKFMGGWEGRTIYFIRANNKPEFWSREAARKQVTALLLGSFRLWGELVDNELTHARETIPVGHTHFANYEHLVRVTFTFLFNAHLSDGRPQVRTEPDDAGVEIRDIVFANESERGFWKDLKDKYGCTEVIVDAKNTETLTRDDLRQLYCYLKPATGLWAFVVCRAPQPELVHAYNRTLFRNFNQARGVLILSDEDLRRMIAIARRGHDPSDYMRERMSAFVRAI